MLLNILKIIVFFVCTQSFSKDSIKVGAQKPISDEVEDSIEIPASLIANESVLITSVVSEKIKKIHFEEGSFVKKGKLLIELKDDEEQAKLLQVVAELEEAELNYNRALKLSEKGNISQSILDNRMMTKKKILGKFAEIKAQIDDLKITAPFNGYTSIRNYSEGSLISPGDVITELYDIQKLKVQAFVPETFTNKININDEMKLELNLEFKEIITGKIIAIDPIIDKKSRTFRIVGKIKNEKNIIKPGMMVNLKIPLTKRRSLTVRENALISQDDLSFVYVIGADNKVLKKKITAGLRKNGMVEILDGLNKDDLVIYEGINKIRVGSIVKLK
ncbi:MAG: efflux RND transporter periplasmic adaptor subunit [Alphaproteobacteria bacterium]|tara:strand:+ start:34 stop:1029 length:996 start_codon:yes stop_codon:yes gene_type:complete